MPSDPPPSSPPGSGSSGSDRPGDDGPAPSTPPPRPSVRPAPRDPLKRPRFLVIALIGALVFGAALWTEGCARLAFYRGERDLSQALHAGIKSDTDRTRAEALFKRFTDMSDDARGRAIPIAAATFVLGAALLALAARGLAGKSNTRNALMQVVTAQAVVVAVAYFVIRDVRNAELDWDIERRLIDQHETLPADQYERVAPMMRGMRPYLLPGGLLMRTLASALIVFALTRPRSREFFEAAGKTVPES